MKRIALGLMLLTACGGGAPKGLPQGQEVAPTTRTSTSEAPIVSISAPDVQEAPAPPPSTLSPPTTQMAPSRPVQTEVFAPPSSILVRTPTSTANSADFWFKLAQCESGVSGNMFQFMGGTAEKVGYYPGASYSEQVAMAQYWANLIHPNEGTSAGWPTCWWIAKG